MIDDADIRQAARELIDRHGDGAMAVAREHVEMLTKGPEKMGLNEALRVLSAVETLLERRRNPSGRRHGSGPNTVTRQRPR